MKIHKLQHFIKASQEDFADAHEPVNDGVKKVPNADDIARQVGRSGGDGSADITKQGEANIVEEKPDDEETETEMTEQVASDNDANDIVEESETTEVEETVEDEPELAHDTVKAVETDEKVTTEEKEALEAFVPLVRRAELIGYTKRQTEGLRKSIGTIRAKAGLKGAFTISAESINESIGLAEDHLVKLARKRKFLTRKVSLENIVEPVISPMNEVPLAHPDSEPLSVEEGLAITEAELGPVVDTVIEQQAMQDTLSTIGQLQAGAVALEQYVALLRKNKGRVTKQTAAIIHAGLEHIDTTCGLRVRSTGLENFDTTPRMAMESTDVDEKSLLDRAGEIGAKILKWLQELMTQANITWEKFSGGISRVQNEMAAVKERLDAIKTSEGGSMKLSGVTSAIMFLDGGFIGTVLTQNEVMAEKEINRVVKAVRSKVSDPIAAALKAGPADEEMFDKVESIVSTHDTPANQARTIELPGGFSIFAMDSGFSVGLSGMREERESSNQNDATVELDLPVLKRSLNQIYEYTMGLGNDEELKLILQANKNVEKALIELRKASKGPDFDETLYQRIQNVAAHATNKFFDIDKYFRVMNTLARIQGGRVKVYNHIVRKLSKPAAEEA